MLDLALLASCDYCGDIITRKAINLSIDNQLQVC